MTERQEQGDGGNTGALLASSQGFARRMKALRVAEAVAFHEAAGKVISVSRVVP